MPPQPLSKVNPKANFRFGNQTFQRYPALAVFVVQVVSLGAIAECKWSEILMHVLKKDHEIAMAMYQALSGGEARRAAVMGAAKKGLSDENFLLFQAVVKATTHARNLRNDFVHHVWGDSPELPGNLLLIEPDCILDWNMGWLGFLEQVPKEADKSRVKVWTPEALQEATITVNEGLLTVAEFKAVRGGPGF